MLALFGGIAGIAWKWREADHERTKAEAVNELLTRRLLAGASHELDPRDKDLTVRAMIDRTAAQLGGWLEGQPEVEARIRETIGGVYLSLGQNDQAAPHLEAALRLDTAALRSPASRYASRQQPDDLAARPNGTRPGGRDAGTA